MSNLAIRADGLSKLYRLGPRERYKALRDTLANTMMAPLRAVKNLWQSYQVGNPSTNNFIWALKDVSFEIKQGESVGIIGRNGAGKSTLLKILSRITEPTEGYAEIHGRVGSLLEVGTGFHPELTGRENIYLSGAILGMKRNEITRKFDEIVAFAEVEKFIDTPVKHYSSGMYMRLAFAVAAHLEPEILLIDEVLAVGDMAFQKKCLGKMDEVAKCGRTVLFVSHNLASVANLCPRAILLVEGKKWSDGESNQVINEYIALGKQAQGEVAWKDIHTAPGNQNVRLHSVRIVCREQITADVDIQQEVHIVIEFLNFKTNATLSTAVHLLDKMGVTVLATWNAHSANLITDDWYGKPHPVGLYRTVCTLPGNFLNEGTYAISVFILTDAINIEVSAHEIISFTVHDTGAMRKEYSGPWIGVVRPRLAWQTTYLGQTNNV